MKKIISVFLVFLLIINSCGIKEKKEQRIILENQTKLIGTWNAIFASGHVNTCYSVQITFDEGGTGSLTYMTKEDSLMIDPPCEILWSVKAEEYKDFGNTRLMPFVYIIRTEERCAGCQSIQSTVPDTAEYMIDYIDADSLKTVTFRKGSLTCKDMFYSVGGSMFSFSHKTLYKQK